MMAAEARPTESASMGRLVRESLAYSTLTVTSAVVAALAVVIYTRMLSPSGYGSYVLAMGAVNVGAHVTGEWLGITPVQYFHLKRSEPAFWSSLVALTLGSFAAGAPLVLVLLVWARKESFIPAGLALFTVLLVSKALGGVLRASGRVSEYTWMSSAAVAAHLGLAAGLYWLTGRLESLLWGAAVAGALTAAALWVVQRDLVTLGAFLHWPSRAMLRRLAGFSAAIPLMGLGSQALQLCDRFLLAVLRGDSEAGLYSANYALGEKATGLAFAPLMMAVYPLAVAKWAQGDRSSAERILFQAASLYLVACGGILAVLARSGDEISRWLLTVRFSGQAHVILIVAVGSAVWGVGQLYALGLYLAEKTMTVAMLVALAAAANQILNLALIPEYGAAGAACATVASYGIFLGVARRASMRTAGLRWAFPRTAALRCGCAGTLAFLTARPLQGIAAALVTGVVYVVALWAMRAPELRDSLTWLRRSR